MKQGYFFCFVIFLLFSCTTGNKTNGKSWTPLFDGASLNNWKVAENASTFTVDSGMIIVHGPRAHLFYDGPLNGHQFKNFELKVTVMTTPGSNSGIFIHTQYQDKDWPSKVYEVQVNNSHTDWRKTGSLYAIQDVKEVYVKDNEWYTEYIMVKDKKITVRINDKTVVEYTEPEGVENLPGRKEKRLSGGTIALQGHDPASKVYYKEVLIRPLPD